MGMISELLQAVRQGSASISMLPATVTMVSAFLASRYGPDVVRDISEFLGRPRRTIRSFALDLLMPMHIAKDAQAALEDIYPIWVQEHGMLKAKLIRAVQVARIILGHHFIPVISFAERILKIVRGGKAAD